MSDDLIDHAVAAMESVPPTLRTKLAYAEALAAAGLLRAPDPELAERLIDYTSGQPMMDGSVQVPLPLHRDRPGQIVARLPYPVVDDLRAAADALGGTA